MSQSRPMAILHTTKEDAANEESTAQANTPDDVTNKTIEDVLKETKEEMDQSIHQFEAVWSRVEKTTNRKDIEHAMALCEEVMQKLNAYSYVLSIKEPLVYMLLYNNDVKATAQDLIERAVILKDLLKQANFILKPSETLEIGSDQYKTQKTLAKEQVTYLAKRFSLMTEIRNDELKLKEVPNDIKENNNKKLYI